MKRAFVVLAFALAIVACSRGAGSKCKGNESVCSDKKSALACQEGVFVQVPCNGPLGCVKMPDRASCDDSIADEGAPCMASGDEEFACSPDKKRALICKDGKFESYRYCRGQYACHFKGDTPTCDETLSLENDPCGLPGYVVCSVDGKDELVCQGSTFTRSRSCKRGCQVTNRPGRPIECD